MNLPAGLATLDPAFAVDQASGWMSSQIFSTLVELDTALQVQPLLARSWEITDSGKTLVFHLREGVTFHPHSALGPDSTRFCTAADVKFSFERICSKTTASPGFWVFNGRVQGVDEFREGKNPSISGFEVQNDSTFVIRLVKPFAPFLAQLAMPFTAIVPKEITELYGKDFSRHPVGTGPFRFKSWQEGSHLILLRNPDYFESENGQRLPLSEAVQVRFIASRVSEFAEFLQGNLHFVNGLDKSIRDEIFDDSRNVKEKYAHAFTLLNNAQLNTEFIALQNDTAYAGLAQSPLRDVRVREALALCIDREALVKYVLNGLGSPAHSGLIPEGLPGYDSASVPGFRYDPARASALLAEAGYPGGKGLPVFTLASTPAYQAVMEFVQKSADRAGITIRIENMQGSALRKDAADGKFLLWRAGWIADYPDGENYLSLLYSSNIPPAGANRMRYRNAAFDSLYELSGNPAGDSARHTVHRRADSLMLRDVPLIPLYYDRVVRLIRPEVSGLETNRMNMLMLKRVQFNHGTGG